MYTADDSALWLERCAQRELYGEPPRFNVWYLDYNPVAAARAHADAHVRQAVRQYAQLLSTVWHLHGAEHITFEWVNTDPRLAGHIDDEPGGYVYLGGQRIYKPVQSTLASSWLSQTRGTYDWLWRCATTLAAEHRLRFGRAHPAEVVLWTLESPPSALSEGGPTQPAPRLPDPFCVVSAQDGDIYDTVGSYRSAYVGLYQRLLRWTRRGPPAWVRQIHGGKYTLTE